MKSIGDKNYKAGRYLLSKTSYDQAIKLCLNNSAYYISRSNCLYAIGDFNSALKDAHKAITFDDKSKNGYECILKCCLNLGDIEGAEVAYKKITIFVINNDIRRHYDVQLKQLRSSIKLAVECFEEKCFYKARMYPDS